MTVITTKIAEIQLEMYDTIANIKNKLHDCYDDSLNQYDLDSVIKARNYLADALASLDTVQNMERKILKGNAEFIIRSYAQKGFTDEQIKMAMLNEKIWEKEEITQQTAMKVIDLIIKKNLV